jgi:hypothetical protein
MKSSGFAGELAIFDRYENISTVNRLRKGVVDTLSSGAAGGEGWGEEETPLSGSLPIRSSWGERV